MAKNRNPIAELAEIIKANPGCVAIVDNDDWTLYKSNPYADGAEPEDLQLADADSHGDRTAGGYGEGNCYGGDLLQALARIVGIKVESV